MNKLINQAFTPKGYTTHIEMPNLISMSNMKPSDKLIFSDIYTLLREGNPYFKSNSEIANHFKISVSSVKRSIARLAKHGLIKKIVSKSKKNQRHRSIVAINVKIAFAIDLTKLKGKKVSNFVDYNELYEFLRRFGKNLRKNPRFTESLPQVQNEPTQVQKEPTTSAHKEPIVESKNNSKSVNSKSNNSQLMLHGHVANGHKNSKQNKQDSSVKSTKRTNKDITSNKQSARKLKKQAKRGADKSAPKNNKRTKKPKRISHKSFDFQCIANLLNRYFKHQLKNQHEWYIQRAINSWLKGNHKYRTRAYSKGEISQAIDKAHSYQLDSHHIHNILALVYHILQKTDDEKKKQAKQRKEQDAATKETNKVKNKNMNKASNGKHRNRNLSNEEFNKISNDDSITKINKDYLLYNDIPRDVVFDDLQYMDLGF